MKLNRIRTLQFFLVLLLVPFYGFSQSTSQNFPSPVTSNEISGVIKARDLGDARLTTFYFSFSSEQGDLFINLVSRNFTGDFDIFALPDLRPVTKIVVYADDKENETGRVLYFRKAERLLLRVQGRSPNDDEAVFRVKFAGSFAAAAGSDLKPESEAPKVSSEAVGKVRVNSVGTILPNPLPSPVAVIVNSDADQPKEPAEPADVATTTVEEKRADETKSGDVSEKVPSAEEPKTAEVAVEPVATKKNRPRRPRPAKKPRPAIILPVTKPDAENPTPIAADSTANEKAEPIAKERKIDPLAAIRLVIELKDGSSFEKTMNEVYKFSADKGVLTVILKDGKISKFKILDVTKVTIQ